jgi:hypothetical protein
MSAPPLPHRVFTHRLNDHTDVPSLEPIDVSSAFAFDFSEFGFASLDASSGEHDNKLSDGESRAVYRVQQSQLSRVEAEHGWRILPPEVWQHIARFACTDGGYTGCVLSLVSREMRAVTAPSRYHTLAFFNPRDITLFAAHLERVGLARVICVVMLIAPQPDANEDFSPGAWPRKTVDQMTVADAALIVLRAVAPTLEMLCSVAWGAVGDKNVLELIEFPVLRDLIWDEGVLDPCGTVHVRGALPSLRRLHVSFLIRPETLVILAPNLVELRISRVFAPNRVFEMFVGESRHPRPYVARRHRTERVPLVPRLLRRIIICPDYSYGLTRNPWATCGDVSDRAAARAVHDNALAGLRCLERPENAWAGEVLLVCKSPTAVAGHRLNWTDLLAGGCGPWISRDQPQSQTTEKMLTISVV